MNRQIELEERVADSGVAAQVTEGLGHVRRSGESRAIEEVILRFQFLGRVYRSAQVIRTVCGIRAHLELPAGAIAEINRTAAGDDVVHRDSPAAGDRIQHSGGVRSKPSALSVGGVVDKHRRAVEGNVVARYTTVCIQIVEANPRIVSVSG